MLTKIKSWFGIAASEPIAVAPTPEQQLLMDIRAELRALNVELRRSGRKIHSIHCDDRAMRRLFFKIFPQDNMGDFPEESE